MCVVSEFQTVSTEHFCLQAVQTAPDQTEACGTLRPTFRLCARIVAVQRWQASDKHIFRTRTQKETLKKKNVSRELVCGIVEIKLLKCRGGRLVTTKSLPTSPAPALKPRMQIFEATLRVAARKSCWLVNKKSKKHTESNQVFFPIRLHKFWTLWFW